MLEQLADRVVQLRTYILEPIRKRHKDMILPPEFENNIVDFSGLVMAVPVSFIPLTCIVRRLNRLIDDWKDHSSRSLVKRTLGIDNNRDSLKMLSERLQNIIAIFLVSFSWRSITQFE